MKTEMPKNVPFIDILTAIVAISLLSLPSVVHASSNFQLSDVACGLAEKDNISGEILNGLFCSGIFFAGKFFTPAAHCLDGRPYYLGKQRHPNRSLYVMCPGGTSHRVIGTIVPQNYFNELRKNKSNEIGPRGQHYSDTRFDFSVLIVETENTSNTFPILPDFPLNTKEVANCRMIGFSKKHCSDPTGKNCFREIASPLERNVPGFLSTNKEEIGDKGDSGAGVVCDKDGKPYLVGIYVSRKENENIIDMFYHHRFLKEILSADVKSLNFQVSKLKISNEWISQQLIEDELTEKTGIKFSCFNKPNKCVEIGRKILNLVVDTIKTNPIGSPKLEIVEYGVSKPYPSLQMDYFENDDVAIFSETGTAYISADAPVNDAIDRIFQTPKNDAAELKLRNQ